MIKEVNEDFKNSSKCWICDNDYIDTDAKVRDHCRITGKHRGSPHRDCNINLKLNRKIPIVLQNLKNYDFHLRLTMQELEKFNLKISVTLNVLEKYMSFTINNNLSFIVSFQFLSSSLDSLVKNLNKNYFKYLSHKQIQLRKKIHLYKYMTEFVNVKEKLSNKEPTKKLMTKNINRLLMF